MDTLHRKIEELEHVLLKLYREVPEAREEVRRYMNEHYEEELWMKGT
jgi:hypothetical protein